MNDCLHCGEEVPNLNHPNLDPWGREHGYFCDDNCHMNAGEAWDERQAEAFYGGSEPFTADEIMRAAERQREELRR